jgi:hypothetical protein
MAVVLVVVLGWLLNRGEVYQEGPGIYATRKDLDI